MSAFSCRRCLSTGPGLAEEPFPGPDGQEILATICAACWSEWKSAK